MASGSGLFVTLEGVEGSGKSTLARLLAERLTKDCHSVVITAEPGGDTVAQKIRELLLDPANTILQRAELLLFEAARAQNVDLIIKPALERGDVVICDRFIDSSLAYQAGARGLGSSIVELLNSFATANLNPDITILLDLPASDGLLRQDGVDRISEEDITFHERVRNTYLTLAQAHPERFVVLNAEEPIDVVLEKSCAAISQRLARSVK